MNPLRGFGMLPTWRVVVIGQYFTTVRTGRHGRRYPLIRTALAAMAQVAYAAALD